MTRSGARRMAVAAVTVLLPGGIAARQRASAK